MGGRSIPHYCEHGKCIDPGGFGVDIEHCHECEAQVMTNMIATGSTLYLIERDQWKERALAAESKLQEALHGAEGKRWNMHRSGDGEIQVCFGDHERGTGCQYVTFVEKSRLDVRERPAPKSRCGHQHPMGFVCALDSGHGGYHEGTVTWDGEPFDLPRSE